VTPPEPIRAGDLTFALDGPDLVDVRWGALEIASRIQVTVRDPDWGTVAARLDGARVGSVAGGAAVVIEGRHDPVGFAWRVAIEADAGGRLTFALDGAAERSFDLRRIGICVLHPWRSYVGAGYEATTPDGTRNGTFPQAIAPQARVGGAYHPMIEAFDALTVAFPGGQTVDIDLEGDLFELEDQRNWTDGSFKTYPTPLARSHPRALHAGERIRQRVKLAIRGPVAPPQPPGAPAVTIGAPTGRSVPPVGMSDTSTPIPRAAHVRIPVHAADPDPGPLSHAELPVELALTVDPSSPDVAPLVPHLDGVRLARVLVLRDDEETSSPDLVDEVRARFGAGADGVPFLGGTATFFSEINRNPPAPGLEGVAFALSPEVHATDERSIRGTLEIQAQVLTQARELAGGASLHPSPVTLAAHVGTRFADAWTVGCLATLASAGAASITIDASSQAAAAVARLRGAALLNVAISDPTRIAALGIAGGQTLVVNLTPDPAPFTLNGRDERPLEPYELRSWEASAASA